MSRVYDASGDLGTLGDAELSVVLSFASAWPHSRATLTCRRFLKLKSEFRNSLQAQVDETMVIFSQESKSVYALDVERRRWVECARPPETGKGTTCGSAAAFGKDAEIMVNYQDSYLAFRVDKNTWRRLPSPLFQADSLVSLSDGSVIAADLKRFSLFDGFTWTPLPEITDSVVRVSVIGVIGETLYVCAFLRKASKYGVAFYAFDIDAHSWRRLPAWTAGNYYYCGVLGSQFYVFKLQDDTFIIDFYESCGHKQFSSSSSPCKSLRSNLPSWFADLGYTTIAYKGRLVLLPGGRRSSAAPASANEATPAILEGDYHNGASCRWLEKTLPSLPSFQADGRYWNPRIIGVALRPPPSSSLVDDG